MLIQKARDVDDKLSVLSRDSQYDLACACGTNDDDRRRRSRDNMWIYPVTLPDRRRVFLFKTLLTNKCVNNCLYCPLRISQDTERCSLDPDELTKTFFNYYKKGKVRGLFLSSGIDGEPDTTMERMNRTARQLRKRRFKGYLHLKVLPGASDAAILDSLTLATAVSLNIEVPGEKNFNTLCPMKNYNRDIISPLNFISKHTRQGARFSHVKFTTQFVVGAAEETDHEIMQYAGWLYRQVRLNRIYFSAYQRGLGAPGVPGEHTERTNKDILMREHRLYQVDWLMRKYGFTEKEIPVGADGNLVLDTDPKEMWARQHPDFFPLNINRADRQQLLRVPGLGEVTVNRIIALRKAGRTVHSLGDTGALGKRRAKAEKYVRY